MNINILKWYLAFCKARDFKPSFAGLKNYNKYFK